MKRLAIWGFDHPSTYPAMIDLQNKNVIDIKAWIGNKQICPNCTLEINDFFRADIVNNNYHGIGSAEYSKIYESSLYKFMDMYTRRNFPFDDMRLHDYLNFFNLLISYFGDLLTTQKIECVIFSNIPHEGPDLILYEVSKQLGIQTIACYQSLFPNRFFYVTDMDDFGTFSRKPTSAINKVMKIERKFEKNLFYMQESGGNISIISRLGKGLQKLNRLNIHSIFIKYLHKMRTAEYQKNITAISSININLETPFVYFPLHLQPELTTSALGGLYSDQILAIERLAQIIPSSWMIYVKENPKQTEFMRSKWFFDRLKSLPKVKVVDRNYDTYLLLKHSKFVSTITGTAGWEAISGGKNALIFGNAWYKGLPGVFTFTNDFELNEILNFTINHSELERRLTELLAKTGTGIVDPAYIVEVKDFCIEQNKESLSQFFQNFLHDEGFEAEI